MPWFAMPPWHLGSPVPTLDCGLCLALNADSGVRSAATAVRRETFLLMSSGLARISTRRW